ncbi:MAG: hypothetical protein EXS37_08555 [Opitutus sp.]|nr:hypothetical protein [Opitutus sp.]
MSPQAKRFARFTFWIVFLAAAAGSAQQIWVRLDPLRNHPLLAPWWMQHNHAQLASAHAPTAVRAWNELERCFLSKWSAYDWVVWRVKEDIWRKDDPPIHFHLRRDGYRYYASETAGPGECRTVNEALMAILHQEPGWKSPHEGDWRKWWDANWTYFPNRERKGLPSGPEDPGGARRR